MMNHETSNALYAHYAYVVYMYNILRYSSVLTPSFDLKNDIVLLGSKMIKKLICWAIAFAIDVSSPSTPFSCRPNSCDPKGKIGEN